MTSSANSATTSSFLFLLRPVMSSSFLTSSRYQAALSSFAEAHSTDPANDAAEYHAQLASYTTQLCALISPPVEPSEALLLASNCQHIRRWEKPRAEYPMGLSGYKTWRANLNKFHASVAEDILLKAGYSAEADAELIARVKDLLMKKGLARPPLTPPFKDPEMQLFEDAICLVFLRLQFVDFASKVSDDDKMVGIVRKTWAKMTDVGRGVVASELVGGLPDDLKAVVGRALQ
ncbi:glutamyl-trna synthetase [Pseudohyphozyma bogoriensis]|nr:glutamyl-trna synthetase [Pseudohyphozyma bogoriensis]